MDLKLLTKMRSEEQVYFDLFIGSGIIAIAGKKIDKNYTGI